MGARLSKFKIGDLALRSALELERARAGEDYDTAPLRDLADALKQMSMPLLGPTGVASMRPGYFEPLERLYRSHSSEAPNSFDQISAFVGRAIAELDVVASNRKVPDTLPRLVNFCIELHREFVRRPAAEGRFGRSQRSVPVEALVC